MFRIIGLVLIFLAGLIYWRWSHVINLFLPSDSRPVANSFPVESVTSAQFEDLAKQLEAQYDWEFVPIAEYRKISPQPTPLLGHRGCRYRRVSGNG